MKIDRYQSKSFEQGNLPDGVDIVILYGPNAGRVSEMSTLFKSKLTDEQDPFSYVPITGEELSDDKARLTDEFASGSLMGGQRLIHIRGGKDTTIASALKQTIDNVQGSNNVILIEAGSLTPRSALRKMGEKEARIAIAPYYDDTPQSMRQFIQAAVADAQKSIDSDAVQALVEYLGTERAVVAQSIEKLITYIGEAPSITLDDVKACEISQSRQTIQELVHAVVDGRLGEIDQRLEFLLSENTPMIVVLRSIQNYFFRLRQAHAHIHDGKSMQQAMDSLQPKVFFKEVDNFKRHLRQWPTGRIDKAFELLTKTEILTKSSDYPDQIITHRHLAQISAQ